MQAGRLGFFKMASIRTQMLLLASVALVALASIAVTVYAGRAMEEAAVARAAAAEAILATTGSLKYDFLDARRREKDFLIRNDENSVQHHAAALERIAAEIDALKIDVLRDRAVELDDIVALYASGFGEIVEIRRDLGLDETQGLQGKMRRSVHKAEEALKAHRLDRLSVLMLMMRRHEKDFMLRLDAKYIAQQAERLNEFKAALAEVPIEETAKAEILPLIQSYVSDFNAFAESRLSVAEKERTLSEVFAKSEPVFGSIQQTLLDRAADARAEATNIASNVGIAIVFSLLVGLAVLTVVAIRVTVGVSRPIGAMTDAMRQLANGDKSVHIPATEYRNEMGAMAQAVDVFKQAMLDVEKAALEREAASQAQAMRATQIQAMSQKFNEEIGGALRLVGEAVSKLGVTSTDMSELSGALLDRSASAAKASQQASHNVQTVAAATEELTLSIREIAGQVEMSADVARTAVERATATDAIVRELTRSVDQIGSTVALVSEISEQTNLLALNATIEAARAGEAGKGFAVVASEVKSLVRESGKATEMIAAHIQQVEASTTATVQAINEIVTTIEKMKDVAAAISAAIEEQSAATNEIARNVEQAAVRSEQVTTNVEEVSGAADKTNMSAREVQRSSEVVDNQSRKVSDLIDHFIAGVRAA